MGLSLSDFTTLHVAISLIGIFSGFIVLYGMLTSRNFRLWTGIFLATTILTSVTGFFFPHEKLLPSHIVGIISLVVLTAALLALYVRHGEGAWRWIYVTSALLALYLNVFVAVVQSFQKLPSLQALAPTQSEPPFIVAQVGVIAVFIILGALAVRRYHPRYASFLASRKTSDSKI
ncbi:hypothetical protein [Hyphomicrobium sp.]|jgi:hypothetical protein|uniref:hypothetical protein n=1 Tax=Hyphomicrobium sp. TaxID=82 RepID=UPI00356A15A5